MGTNMIINCILYKPILIYQGIITLGLYKYQQEGLYIEHRFRANSCQYLNLEETNQ